MTRADLIRAVESDIPSPDREQAETALQQILATGDLAPLEPPQRVAYYLTLTRSLSLNPLSRPFDWLVLDGRLVLYPNKSCAEQLRRLHQISVRKVRAEPLGELFVVEVEGRTPDGRTDYATKYVPLTVWNQREGRHVRLNSRELANAYAKAETGAKRRLVLSMVGLSTVPDLDDVANARTVIVDGRGNVVDTPSDEQKALAADPKMAAMLGEPTYETTAAEAGLDTEPEVSQAPTEAELEPPKRPIERQSFKPSDDQVTRWCAAWFGAVRETSLDTDDARHEHVRTWTAKIGWPTRKQTESLRTMFLRMTEDEAAKFLNHARAIVAAEKGQYVVPDSMPAADGPEPETPF
jgi:hypothetical protein